MPLYRKQRGSRGRRSYYKRAPGNIMYRRMLNKSLRMAKFLNAEFKFIDTTREATLGSGSAYIQPLVLSIQGDTDNDRNGNSIKVTSLYINFHLILQAGVHANVIRIIVYRDSQTNGALLSTADLLAETADPQLAVISPLNIDNKYRFRVLHDKICPLGDGQLVNFYYKKHFTLNDHIRYKSNTGTISDLTSVSYGIMAFSDASSNMPTLNLYARMRYVDN